MCDTPPRFYFVPTPLRSLVRPRDKYADRYGVSGAANRILTQLSLYCQYDVIIHTDTNLGRLFLDTLANRFFHADKKLGHFVFLWSLLFLWFDHFLVTLCRFCFFYFRLCIWRYGNLLGFCLFFLRGTLDSYLFLNNIFRFLGSGFRLFIFHSVLLVAHIG